MASYHGTVSQIYSQTVSVSNPGIATYVVQNLPAGTYYFAVTAYNSTGNNQNLMLTETAVLNPKTINETRFQFTRNYTETIGNLLPQINVSGAFTAGGAHYLKGGFGVRHTTNDVSNAYPGGFVLLNWGSTFVNQFIDRGRVKKVFVQGEPESRMLPQDLDRW